MVPKEEILGAIRSAFALEGGSRDDPSSPSVTYRFADGNGDVGVIASVTEPFCGGCTRLRLTADGKLVTCLFSERGHDVKTPLRSGASDGDLERLISSVWRSRGDRYSEDRFEALRSIEGYASDGRRKIEMIRLGG
jgi:cyclic pyranopterin phosphate synthase